MQLVLILRVLFALCTEFTMFRFANHIFSVVPCTVHSDLAYAAYSYSSGSFLTVLVLSFFCIFFFYVFPVCYPFAVSVLCRQYSVVSLYMYVVCVVSILFLCFGWCPCIFGEAIVFFSCDCF